MAARKLPSTILAVITSPKSSKLTRIPAPVPGAGEVLVRNVAVASNPKDWKVPLRSENYAFVEGNDVAGTIAAVGTGVTEFKEGERVAAFTKMGTKDNKYGAYAEYSVAPVSTTFKIAESVKYEDASTLPLAAMTAVIGLFRALGVPEPPASGKPAETSSSAPGIIINGASSSVGAFAVQLAKRAGLFVVGVAGSSSDYAKELGADIIVDYRSHSGDALVSALVKAASDHPISHAYDAVSQNGSSVLLGHVLSKTSPDGKGKVTFVLGLTDEETAALPAGVTAERTSVGTAYGENEEFAARWYRQLGRWLAPTEPDVPPFLPNRVRVLPNGLASVEHGLELLKSGKVHAEKLVYRIAETPGVGEEDGSHL